MWVCVGFVFLGPGPSPSRSTMLFLPVFLKGLYSPCMSFHIETKQLFPPYGPLPEAAKPAIDILDLKDLLKSETSIASWHSGLHRQASRMGSKHIYFTGPNGILRCGLHVGGHDILDVCSNRVGVWVSFSESLGNVECESSRLSWTQLDRHGKNSSKTLYVGRCNGWRLFGHSMYVYVCKIWRCSVLGAWYDDLARL